MHLKTKCYVSGLVSFFSGIVFFVYFKSMLVEVCGPAGEVAVNTFAILFASGFICLLTLVLLNQFIERSRIYKKILEDVPFENIEKIAGSSGEGQIVVHAMIRNGEIVRIGKKSQNA